jgi:hypothetical protein
MRATRSARSSSPSWLTGEYYALPGVGRGTRTISPTGTAFPRLDLRQIEINIVPVYAVLTQLSIQFLRLVEEDLSQSAIQTTRAEFCELLSSEY